MARTDWHSIEHLNDIFVPHEGKVWFIEKIKTEEWLVYVHKHFDDNWIELTKDPQKAMAFKTQMKALEFCNMMRLNPDEYTQTEHEFV